MWIMILMGIFMVIGVPVGINWAFKMPAFSSILEAEWTAGELLGYYGSVLGGVVSFTVLYFTLIHQKKEAEEAEKRSKRIYLDVAFDRGSYADVSDRKALRQKAVLYDLEEGLEYPEGVVPAEFIRITNYTSECLRNLEIEVAYEAITAPKSETKIEISLMRPDNAILIRLPKTITTYRAKEKAINVMRSFQETRIQRVSVKYITPAGELLKCITELDTSVISYSVIKRNGGEEVLFKGKDSRESYYFTDD